MSKVIALLVGCTMHLVVCGQATPFFTDSTANWFVANTYPHGSLQDPNFTETTTRRYFINGDTVVNGDVWRMFLSVTTLGGDTIHEGAARATGDMVEFIGAGGTPSTLYDFSIAIDDSVDYTISGTDVWLHVSGVDSILVDGNYHRTIDFGPYEGAPEVLNERWIEGIGSVHGPLFPAHPRVFETEVPGDSLMLTCYGAHGAQLWNHPGYSDCTVNIVLSIAEKGPDRLRISPNPARNQLHVDLDHTERIQLLDATGRLVLDRQVDDPKAHDIDIGQLPNGLYSLRVLGASGWTSGKFIKE